MSTNAVIDISLFNEANINESNNNSELSILGSDPVAQNIFYDKTIEIIKDIDIDSKSGIILLSKLNDIVNDFNRLYLILRQLDHFEQNNLVPLYKKEYHPHMHYIYDNDSQYIYPYWIRSDVSLNTRIKISMRNIINKLRASTNKKNIVDGYMINPLLLSYIKNNKKSFLDYRLHEQSWGKLKNSPCDIEDTIDIVKEIYSNILLEYRFNKKYSSKARNILESSINYHMRKASHDYELLPGIFDEKYMQSVFVSGTPKYLGRLVSSYYQKMSKSVWRFAHGGDRAFFNDYNFSIVEFPYCNKYFCHSQTEANNIKQRLDEKRLINIGFSDIKFTSNTNIRSINIYKNSIKPNLKRKKNIVYFCATFVGERLVRPMNERCPDIQYIEWQSWLLLQLKKLNYNITIKRHPKGILTNALFYEKYFNNIECGDFNRSQHSCYLFDFFGTAMFDAMATKTGVVYFDMGLRELDKNSEKDFHSRCKILKCSLQNNRFRVDEKELTESIEIAINYNYKDASVFYENYIN